MFEINDDFLVNIGYDLSLLSDEQKDEYKRQYTNDLAQRIGVRLFDELDDKQASEFSDIQESPERARRWLDEFHTDYKTREDYKQILANAGGDDEGASAYYAGILWMGDAVPDFGLIIRDELEKYQQELIQKRKAAEYLVDDLENE